MDGDKLLELSSHISIPFHTSKEAEVAFNALRVDKEPPRGGCHKTLSLKGQQMIWLQCNTISGLL